MTALVVAFLLARLAEDEAKNGCNGEGEYATCWQRSERIGRECEAKRRIVGFLTDAIAEHDDAAVVSAYADAVQILAAVYVDHPDFDEAWRL